MLRATPLRFNLVEDDDDGPAVVEIFDYIDTFWGFSVPDLQMHLRRLDGRDLTLRVHSRGGNAMEGFAMFGMLESYKGRVEAEIVGLAASAASVVVMAASKITISEVGFIMIHDPWVFADGNAAVLRRTADMLDQIAPAIVRAYGRHAKISAAQIAAAMAEGEGAGTWYDAEAAIEAGLAHEKFSAPAVPQNRISLDGLGNVPADVLNRYGQQAPDGQGRKSPERTSTAALTAQVLEGLRESLAPADLPALGNHEDDGRLEALVEQYLSRKEAA